MVRQSHKKAEQAIKTNSMNKIAEMKQTKSMKRKIVENSLMKSPCRSKARKEDSSVERPLTKVVEGRVLFVKNNDKKQVKTKLNVNNNKSTNKGTNNIQNKELVNNSNEYFTHSSE